MAARSNGKAGNTPTKAIQQSSNGKPSPHPNCRKLSEPEQFISEDPIVTIADQQRLIELLPSHPVHEIEKLHQIALALEKMGPCEKTRIKYVTRFISGEVIWTQRQYYADTAHGEAPTPPVAPAVNVARRLLNEIGLKNYQPSAQNTHSSSLFQKIRGLTFARILKRCFWEAMESARLNKARGLRSLAYCLSETISEGAFLFERSARDIQENECPQTDPPTQPDQYSNTFSESDKAIFCWRLLAAMQIAKSWDQGTLLQDKLKRIFAKIPNIPPGDRKFVKDQFFVITKALGNQSLLSHAFKLEAAHAVLQDQSGIRKLLSGFLPSASNQSRAMKESGLNRLPDRKENRGSLIEKEAERLRQTMRDYGLDPE